MPKTSEGVKIYSRQELRRYYRAVMSQSEKQHYFKTSFTSKWLGEVIVRPWHAIKTVVMQYMHIICVWKLSTRPRVWTRWRWSPRSMNQWNCTWQVSAEVTPDLLFTTYNYFLLLCLSLFKLRATDSLPRCDRTVADWVIQKKKTMTSLKKASGYKVNADLSKFDKRPKFHECVWLVLLRHRHDQREKAPLRQIRGQKGFFTSWSFKVPLRVLHGDGLLLGNYSTLLSSPQQSHMQRLTWE